MNHENHDFLSILTTVNKCVLKIGVKEKSWSTNRPVISDLRWMLWCLGLRCVMVVWQLGCRGELSFLEALLCRWCSAPFCQYAHGGWCSFCQHRRDDGLSRPPEVLIRQSMASVLLHHASKFASAATQELSLTISVSLTGRSGVRL